MPHCKRDHVVETLVHEGGIGHETHVGEFIVCKECENCVVVMVVCTQARAGELMNVLTRAGVGVAFGTITSIPVASQRPNPVALVGEFKELKAKVEAQAEEDLGKDRQFQRKWNRRKARLEKHKIEYVTTSTTKSVEELFNEIVEQSYDGWGFYISVMCASVIAGVGLLTNSAVVVLSAMLISPLMGPILSAAFGLAIGDPILFWGSVFAEVRAALVTILMGMLIGLIYGPYAVSYGENPIPTGEMSGRGQTAGLLGGLIIALASGVVVANAISSSGVNSLVGVAISASLLPPIVNSGIMIVFAFDVSSGCSRMDQMCTYSRNDFLKDAGISFALYFINVVVIIIVAGGIFYNQKVGRFRGFLVATETHDLLDVANAHVRKKLQVATGIKGAVDDRAFDHILSEVTHMEPRTDVEGAPEDGLVSGSMGKIPSEHISDEFSVLRPFDEPRGIKRPSFAKAEDHKQVFNWVKDVHHLITR